MTNDQGSRTDPRAWRWTFASGVATILLGVVAFFMPEIEWATGGLVGWMLLLAGAAEAAFGVRRGTDRLGVTVIVSGLLTAFAGLIFVTDPSAAYLRVVNIVLLWLIVRGMWVLGRALAATERPANLWLGLGGMTDVLLAIVLAVGVPVSVFVVTLFGPTPEIVAKFSLILAASFIVTGISQIAIARAQSREPAQAPAGL